MIISCHFHFGFLISDFCFFVFGRVIFYGEYDMYPDATKICANSHIWLVHARTTAAVEGGWGIGGGENTKLSMGC